ncbi:ATP synthase F1 subunit delta [Paracrocinitomix mangrovi]|uniref:ATP synthase F1 subunit delta n=1 Tax=Paracrocinitomix mangrovi TaxID=2862509 RepID=UPI001C8EED1D|nr:ATP synthase F1 subunit delta [Paracrocinitomix mangrovi]UKN00364.1 ATP synthase F1 subunit delta [Paracrocinitomix mangrovi]
MAASKAAIRYATAYMDLAIEMKSIEKVYADVQMLDSLCYDSREFMAFLDSPIIQKRKKNTVYDAMFQGKVEKMTLEFLKLITKNSRENLLPEITESFISQYKKHKGIVVVNLKSAVALEDKVKKAIVAKVNEHFKGDVELNESVDQSLIGGFIVSVEDKQIDASIKSQLANLKNILLN